MLRASCSLLNFIFFFKYYSSEESKISIAGYFLLALLTGPSTLERFISWPGSSRSPPSGRNEFIRLRYHSLPSFPYLSFMCWVSNCFFPGTDPSSLLTLPWQAFVFWRLTHCGALTGSAEQRSPGESSHLFLCLFECSFKDQVLKSCISTDDILGRGERVICFSTKKMRGSDHKYIMKWETTKKNPVNLFLDLH